MYHDLLTGLRRANPNVVLIGLTATPWRTETGRLDEDYGKVPKLFDGIAYEIPIKPLIRMGHLSKLTTVTDGLIGVFDPANRKMFSGSKTQSALDDAVGKHMATQDRKAGAGRVGNVLTITKGRRSILVFCSSIAHAEQVTAQFRKAGEAAECVTGQTARADRDRIIADYKAGTVRIIVNVGVLTTGFDAPATDAIVLFRMTQSPGLHAQMLGRGMRTAKGKTDCLILDYVGNTGAHGPIDRMHGRKLPPLERVVQDDDDLTSGNAQEKSQPPAAAAVSDLRDVLPVRAITGYSVDPTSDNVLHVDTKFSSRCLAKLARPACRSTSTPPCRGTPGAPSSRPARPPGSSNPTTSG